MPNPTVISADSHVQEPDELYTERLDTKFRDRVPRVVVHEDGAVIGTLMANVRAD